MITVKNGDTPIEALAKSLGATIQGGINWTWALWDKSDAYGHAKADQFDAECVSRGLETRGVYKPTDTTGYGVRFR